MNDPLLVTALLGGCPGCSIDPSTWDRSPDRSPVDEATTARQSAPPGPQRAPFQGPTAALPQPAVAPCREPLR